MSSSYDEINRLLEQGAKVEALQKIMALKESELALREKNLQLEEELSALRAKAELKGKVNHKPPFFYLEGEDKPLCPKCWQEKQKTNYLLSEAWNKGTRYDCPVCQFSQIPKGVPVSRVVRMRR
jgi:hypothetical protein